MKPWKDTPETCATCAIRHPQTSVCQLTGQQVSNEDFCSKHAETIETCELCHKPTLQTLCFPAEGGYHFLCQDCFRLLSTCRMCASGKYCAFEADTTLPKQVMQTVRQGHMVMQTQVRNPELVNKTCKAGCKCYDNAGQYCRREDGYCIEHDFQSPF
jgi:hypothetical protein